ncbi:MAG: phosphoribosyltransferase family protein [Thermomicrobiales bacterium]
MSDSQLKRIIDWSEVDWLVQSIVRRVPIEPYDIVLVITRGGMVPACLISERLHLRNIMVAAVQFHNREGENLDAPVFWQFPDDEILQGKSVMIVDDVWDSGRTAVSVRNRVRESASRADLVVLHYKPTVSEFPDESPDIYGEITQDWIIYPWDEFENSSP